MTVQHKDLPNSQLHEAKGASSASIGQIYIANGDGTATFQNSPYTSTEIGWWDYNDTATSSTPISLTTAGTEYQLTNNGLGSRTLKTFALSTIADIWNTSTNYFGFTGMKIGDTVDVRVDIEITTASTNNLVDVILEAGIGGTSYKITFAQLYLKSSGVHKLIVPCNFYIGDSNTLSNSARLLIKNDTVGSTVKVNGWYVRATTNG